MSSTSQRHFASHLIYMDYMDQIMYTSNSLKGLFSITGQRLCNGFLLTRRRRFDARQYAHPRPSPLQIPPSHSLRIKTVRRLPIWPHTVFTRIRGESFSHFARFGGFARFRFRGSIRINVPDPAHQYQQYRHNQVSIASLFNTA
jgi:hypothetical protein